MGEVRSGNGEAERHGNGASDEREQSAHASQTVRDQWPGALRVVRVAALASRPALENHEPHNHGKHGEGDLGRSGKVRPSHPGGIDRHRQRTHAEELGRADVVQGFHQHQTQSNGDGRARQRERDTKEHAGSARAKSPRRVDEVCGLHQEHRTRGQIHVRVEHETDQENAPHHRSHVGKSEVARALDAKDRAQPALDGADRVKDVEIGVGDDIRGNGKGGAEATNRAVGGPENRRR